MTSVTQGATGDGRFGVLTLIGDLDLAVREDLLRAVTMLLSAPVQGYAVDLGGVDFTDATGINSLVALGAGAAARDRPVVLAAIPAPVDRLLRLFDLYLWFDHQPTLDAAVRMLAAGRITTGRSARRRVAATRSGHRP
jgi:anti-anti-sigma factor